MKLFPYQDQGVTDVRNAYKQKFRAPLYVLPTGGGKTVVFSHIAGEVSRRLKNVQILVHRIELLRQTSDALDRSGVPHGLINAKFTPQYHHAVQVASVQTLVKRIEKQTELFQFNEFLPEPDLIIIDEAHHATAGSWRKVVEKYPNALVLGVTATPIRGDGKGLGIEFGGLFDTLIMGPQIGELIAMGRLCKPTVYAPLERIDFSGVKTTKGDYDKDQIAELVNRNEITGNAVSHYTKVCPGVPCVVFCINVIHAEAVAEEFRMAGYRAIAVDGELKDDERKDRLDGLGNGKYQIVTSCDLISEGTDIPAIVCAILLRPTKSTGLYIQQVGRALRTLEGKARAFILDHVGNVLYHGMPTMDRHWTLEGTKKKKRNVDSFQAIKTRQCPKCYCVHEHAPSCPGELHTGEPCLHVYKVEKRDAEPTKVDGELQEITPDMEVLIKKQARMEVGKAKTLEELKAIARARGYKESWADHIYAAKEKKNVSNLI